MKLYLLLLSIFLATYLCRADSLRVEISGYSTIDNSFRKLSSNAGIFDRDVWHGSDIPKQTLTNGLLLRFSKSLYYGISLGVQVSNKGFRSRSFYVREDLISHSYTIQRLAKYKIDYGYRFYDLILGLNAKYKVGKVSIGLDGGITIGLGIGDQIVSKTLDGVNTAFYYTNRQLGLSTFVLPKIDFYATSRISIGAIGHLRFSPIPYDKNVLLLGKGAGLCVTYLIK